MRTRSQPRVPPGCAGGQGGWSRRRNRGGGGGGTPTAPAGGLSTPLLGSSHRLPIPSAAAGRLPPENVAAARSTLAAAAPSAAQGAAAADRVPHLPPPPSSSSPHHPSAPPATSDRVGVGAAAAAAYEEDVPTLPPPSKRTCQQPLSVAATSVEDNAAELVPGEPWEPMEPPAGSGGGQQPPEAAAGSRSSGGNQLLEPVASTSSASAPLAAVAASSTAAMPHSGGHAADLVIFGGSTRESGVQTMGVGASMSGAAVACGVGGASALAVDAKPPVLVLPDDLKLNLECPVCSRITLPPIMQCRNGHVTCNTCRLKVQSCPLCRETDIDIRNMFAEKAITYMSIPCEFVQFGCKVEVQYRDKESHERVCKYRPYICPYIECDHKLSSEAVVEHVSTAHREECRRSDGPEITASMILIGMYFGGDGAWSPRVITCFGKTFFDVALTRDRWLHHWVWLLGEEEEAQQYLYEITAFKGQTKYVYGGEVSSLRTSDDEIVAEGQCLSISDAIGRRLRDGDKIRYKLKLFRRGGGGGDGPALSSSSAAAGANQR